MDIQDEKDEAKQKTAEAQEEAKKVDASAKDTSLKAADQKDPD